MLRGGDESGHLICWHRQKLPPPKGDDTGTPKVDDTGTKPSTLFEAVRERPSGGESETSTAPCRVLGNVSKKLWARVSTEVNTELRWGPRGLGVF